MMYNFENQIAMNNNIEMNNNFSINNIGMTNVPNNNMYMNIEIGNFAANNNIGMNNGMNNFPMNNNMNINSRLNNVQTNNNMSNSNMIIRGINNNEMNNIGNNNQSYFMNNNSQNNIIQLQNEISQLKQIIIDKDKQIHDLTEKLNNIRNSFNINQLNNLPSENKNDEITIVIQSNDFKCNKNVIAYSLINKLNHNLTINYRPIELNKTLEENEIYDGSIINITDQIYNLCFEKNGIRKTLPLDGNCPFSFAITFYFNRFDSMDLYHKALAKKIFFRYNNNNLDINDKTPINKIFKNYSPLINIIE